MADSILNLTPDEKRAFSFLFDKADTDQLGVITGERAVSFFERTGIPSQVLGEIWGIADQENRGLLTKSGFGIALRLIGHYQSGKQPTPELAFQPAPVPKFDGLQLPSVQSPTSPTRAAFPPTALQPQNSGQGIRIPPLDPAKVAQYTGLFERSGAQNGLLDGLTAKAIFERAGLPVDVLGKIWTLADREQRGGLDQTEFIVAMHLLTSMKSKAMAALPATLPQGFYDAAARRGAPPPPPPQARQTNAIPRQFSGSARTASPLTRPAYAPWLVAAQDKAKYDQFFANIDTQGHGAVSGEQAVGFFSESGLPEDILASIWDLADINSEGRLNKDEFAVAMYLIRQQRAQNAPALPAFLPPQLIPPSMRKTNLQQQTQQTTAPAFDAAPKPTLPKSAAEDLFGLDEPVSAPTQQPLAPTATGDQVRDPFAGSSSTASNHPSNNSTFKPFVPSSAFGASLAQQNTGASQPSQPRTLPTQSHPAAMDDLLGDSDAGINERSKLNNDTTELANMSNQIGNLHSQMEQTQSQKLSNQADLSNTNTQKRDLEVRLQQFRAQYEQEVRAVKDLEQQLISSRESTKKLGQELALLEGTHQDLQTQHQSISQALQADQSENAALKQKIAQINTDVNRLKPEIEKLKLDARQQKGMVSINKKQLITNEADHDRLQAEKTTLEREAVDAESVQSPPTTKDVVSPSSSTISATNPFFRKPGETERAASPAVVPESHSTAFDQLFGPSFAGEGKKTPPATSFGARAAPLAVGATLGAAAGAVFGAGMTDSVSSDGKLTPVATPTLERSDIPSIAEPPPLSEEVQFTPAELPVGGLQAPQEEDAVSTSVIPPASRASFTPEATSRAVTPLAETVPGAFPSESGPPTTSGNLEADFDSAFASFGTGEQSPTVDNDDPFTTSFPKPSASGSGLASEFPPIQSLEHEEDSSDSENEDAGFGDSFAAPRETTATSSTAAAFQPPASELPPITAQTSPPTYKQSEEASTDQSATSDFPKEFTGLLPARESGETLSTQSHSANPVVDRALPVVTASIPGTTPTSTVGTSDIFHEASSQPLNSSTDDRGVELSGHQSLNGVAHAPANVFDEFDEFEDLAEAKEAEKGDAGFDFGFPNHGRGDSEFNAAFDSPAAAFDSPAASTITSRTPTAASITHAGDTNGFTPAASVSSPFATTNSSLQNTPQAQHDWDSIFSGLDNSNTGAIDTPFTGNDPWSPTSGAAQLAQAKKDLGRSVTPGTEHDDPILKRLTGMGYPRADALHALETFDYDINKAVDHLSTK